MLPRQQAKLDEKIKRDTMLIANRTSIYVAVIAAITVLLSTTFTYFFNDKVRTEISTQTLALERIKADISKNAQLTAETVAAIDKARLEIQRQSANIDHDRLDLQRQAARIDDDRLDLQREIALTSSRNDAKRISIDDQLSKANEIRLGSELARARNDLIPIMEFQCSFLGRFSSRLIKVDCRFKNTGIHLFMITPVKVELLNLFTQKVVDDGIEWVDNKDSNTIPVGVSGSNTYDIHLSQKEDNIQSKSVRITVRVLTDAVAVDKLRAIAKGYISKKELESVSTQTYTFTLPIN